MRKRSYNQTKRAESAEATRLRIVEALMALHEELGPRYATISAVAERAGVQRLTVYRHFPNETAMFEACTARWLELHPPPSPETWADAADASAQCRAALRAFYAYYRLTERMWTVSHRDESEVPALQGPMTKFRAYLDAIAADLIAQLSPPRDRLPLVHAAVGHALDFATWRSLSERGLNDRAAADFAAAWIDIAAAAKPRRKP